jgi:hypothetical protein
MNPAVDRGDACAGHWGLISSKGIVDKQSLNRAATGLPRWGQKRRSGHFRRPSGLPSNADILLRCREPPLWAKTRHVQQRSGAPLGALVQEQTALFIHASSVLIWELG